MKKIAIVYFSQTGTTEALAKAVACGAETQGAQVFAYRILGSDIIEGRFKNDALFEELSEMDAIIFGSPTYMGGPTAQFKAFADASSESWSKQRWKNKLAAKGSEGSLEETLASAVTETVPGKSDSAASSKGGATLAQNIC